MVLLLSWPQVHEVCPNYEVVMLQPQKGTSLDLGYVANCYVALLLIPAPLFCLSPDVCPGGQPALAPSIFTYPTVLYPHSIILPSGSLLSPYRHTNILCYMIQIQLPPPVPRPFHACHIPISSKVYLSCFQAAVFRHHGSWRLPPPW